MRVRRTGTAVVLVLGLACSGGIGAEKPRNLLLISIDTLRADRLGCYGHAGKASPNIDALASRGTLFRRAVAPAPLTLPSHASLLTGTSPLVHGVHDNNTYRLSAEQRTLAEVAKDAGYATGAVVSAFVLDSRFGLDQGFGTYDDRFDEPLATNLIVERRAEETTRHALSWLEGHADEPFFLFVHYYDPHMLYDPPEPYRTRFASDPYLGEIAYVDAAVGQLLQKLDGLGITDSTVVVLTSDHGEMLGEHGETTHGYFVYDTALRVPLLVRAPGRSKAAKVDTPVSLVDVVPTVCALLGLPAPAGLDGIDLGPFLAARKAPPVDRDLYAESWQPTHYGCDALRSMTSGPWKYIHAPHPELYDLEHDPGERENLAETEPDRAAELREAMILALAKPTAGNAPEPRVTLDPEAKERLESLGYVASGSTAAQDASRGRDAKDFIAFHEESRGIPTLVQEGKLDEATARTRALLARMPDFVGGHLYLARIARAGGRPLEAVDHYHEALRLDANRPDVENDIGALLTGIGQTEHAIEHLQEALRLDPAYADARNNLGNARAALGRADEAIAEYVRALELEPDSAEINTNLATQLLRQQRPEEAYSHFRAALQFDPSAAAAHFGAASALLRGRPLDEERVRGAMGHLLRAVEIDPAFAQAHYMLSRTLVMAGQFPEALEHLERAAAAAPSWAAPSADVAWVLATHPDPSVRKPQRALELAARAAAVAQRDVRVLDALAAAEAASGHYDRATASAERAIEIDAGIGGRTDSPRGKPLRERLALYRSRTPYVAQDPRQALLERWAWGGGDDGADGGEARPSRP